MLIYEIHSFTFKTYTLHISVMCVGERQLLDNPTVQRCFFVSDGLKQCL